MKHESTPFLAIFFLLSLLSLSSFAQETKTPVERAEKITGWMKRNLSLTEDQVASVQEINLRYARKNEELRDDSSSRLQKAKKLKSNDEAKDKELKTLLSDEQFKTYQLKKDEIREELKEQAKENKKRQG